MQIGGRLPPLGAGFVIPLLRPPRLLAFLRMVGDVAKPSPRTLSQKAVRMEWTL
jgi:hypothetical protein